MSDEKKKYISHSQISSYLGCGEKYRRRYIEKEIIPPGIALVKGSAVHKGAEINFKQKIESHTDMPKNQVVEAAVENVKQRIGAEGLYLSSEEESIGKSKIVNTLEQSVVSLTTLYSESIAPRYQPKIVEGKQLIPLPGMNMDLLGVLDCVDDKDIIVDLKTSGKKKTQADVDANSQFTVYALIHNVLTGKPPAGINVEVLVEKKESENQTLSTNRDRDDYNALIESVVEVTKGIQAEVFQPAYGTANNWMCNPKWCGYAMTCRFIPLKQRNAWAKGNP